MEEKKEEKGTCCSMHHGDCIQMKHHLVKKIFMLIVLLVVFCMGMQLGELKGELRGGRGSHEGMMRSYGYDNNYYAPKMMGGYGQINLTTPTTPIVNTSAIPVAPIKQ